MRPGGVFIASDHAMYRFDSDAQGRPVITWREAYDRVNRQKAGTGTRPTLMPTEYVTIIDNADPQSDDAVRLVKSWARRGNGRLALFQVPLIQKSGN